MNGTHTLGARSIVQIGMGWFSEEPGGLNRMFAGLRRGLVEGGADVRSCVAGDPSVARDAPADVAFFARRDANLVGRLASCRRTVRAALRARRADVVAAHFAPYALPVLDLVADARFVFHFHGPWAAESLAEGEGGAAVLAKRTMERIVYRRASRFIVLSHAFAQLLARSYGVDMSRIHVVPGGVDVARLAIDAARGAAREALGLSADRPVVGVVRRLVRRVGLEGLLEAMVQARAAAPEVLLAIAGAGPLAAELAARVDSLGLKDNVRFMGFVADDRLPLFYRACDVTIVPSVALEGFGLTTIESLAAGTPVLVTPVGGLPETVAGLDPDLVLPGMGSGPIGAVLAEVLRGTRTLPDAQRCAAHARAEFDWPVIAAKTLAVYA